MYILICLNECLFVRLCSRVFVCVHVSSCHGLNDWLVNVFFSAMINNHFIN